MTLVLFRRLGSWRFAGLSTLLVFGGSGLAYVPAMLWPETARFDHVVWSSMFLAPSATWLFFNAWTPALAVVSLGLYAVDRMRDSSGRGWLWVAAVSFGLLFMVKSFAFGVMLPALGITAMLWMWRKDRWGGRLLLMVGLAGLCALPWLIAVLGVNSTESRAVVSIDWMSLPRRMLFKMDLREALGQFVVAHVGPDPTGWMTLTVATAIFLVGGLGLRVLGLWRVCASALGREPVRRWTPLAWVVILGVTIPFVVAVAPFPNSIQAYQLALFALWPFAAAVVWPVHARSSFWRWAASVALVAGSLPVTVHYARVAHDASRGTPLASLDAGDLLVVHALQATPADRTMILHSDPLQPSLYAIESQRRVVLAWSSYVEGDGNPDVEARAAEIARFFGSPQHPGADDLEILHRYHVTHVIERTAVDDLNPDVRDQLVLVAGAPGVRLYRVPVPLSR